MIKSFDEMQNHFEEHREYDTLQREIRARCGNDKPISRTTWNNWMTGKTKPNKLQRQQISETLQRV